MGCIRWVFLEVPSDHLSEWFVINFLQLSNMMLVSQLRPLVVEQPMAAPSHSGVNYLSAAWLHCWIWFHFVLKTNGLIDISTFCFCFLYTTRLVVWIDCLWMTSAMPPVHHLKLKRLRFDGWAVGFHFKHTCLRVLGFVGPLRRILRNFNKAKSKTWKRSPCRWWCLRHDAQRNLGRTVYRTSRLARSRCRKQQ